LRQGNANSSLLFNVVLEIANGRSIVETRELYMTNVVQLWHNTYVMVIVGRGLLDIGEVFTTLAGQQNKIGLEINEKKTKFMAASWQPYNE